MARKTLVLNAKVDEILTNISFGQLGDVTYVYNKREQRDKELKEDYKKIQDIVQVCPINKEMFKDEHGRRLSNQSIYKVFQDTQWDRGADSFYISI